MALARVANGARCQTISVAPQQVSQSRRNQKLECKLRGLRGEPCQLHHKHRVRLRIEAATMRTAIVLLALVADEALVDIVKLLDQRVANNLTLWFWEHPINNGQITVKMTIAG
jgi:hypothetical protein